MSSTLVGERVRSTVTIIVDRQLREQLTRAARRTRSLGAEVRVALRRHFEHDHEKGTTMPRLANVHRPYEGVYGAELLSAPSTTSQAHVLLAASPQNVAWAREYFEEIDEGDVDWRPIGKRRVTHRATSENLVSALACRLDARQPERRLTDSCLAFEDQGTHVPPVREKAVDCIELAYAAYDLKLRRSAKGFSGLGRHRSHPSTSQARTHPRWTPPLTATPIVSSSATLVIRDFTDCSIGEVQGMTRGVIHGRASRLPMCWR